MNEESQVEYPKDILGREKCPRCGELLPAASEGREIHLMRHTLEDLMDTLEWIGKNIEHIRHRGIPAGERGYR
jgi:transcription initiation factor IIE alpha subunit